MDSPHVLHELELLPLNPSSYTAQPACISLLPHGITVRSIMRMSAEGERSAQSVRAGAGIDVNQLPSSSKSEDELIKEGPLCNTNASAHANGQDCASSKPICGPTHPQLTKLSYSEHERTLGDVSLRAREAEEALIARKKVRLSKEKSTVLEDMFKESSNLNSKRKIALADQLNLQPRQVEVWFQNRRARTKLKKTEVEIKVLKRCCEALIVENRRLQKEILELKASKMGGQCVIPRGFCPSLLRSAGSSCDCFTPQFFVAPATSTTTSMSSFNEPSNNASTLSSHQQLSPSL